MAAIPRNFGMLQYTITSDMLPGNNSGDPLIIESFSSSDDFGMCFGGVTPKEPTAGQRPIYRAWFVPTALGDSDGLADAGLVTLNLAAGYGGIGSTLNSLQIQLINYNALSGRYVAGTLYVELIHSIVQ